MFTKKSLLILQIRRNQRDGAIASQKIGGYKMSLEQVKEYFKTYGMEHRIQEFEISSATVPLAAKALHCEESRIAKTLSFHVGEKVVLIVTAGDAKIDNAKYKAKFQTKAKMLSFDEAEPLIGHAVGGVCPFAVNPGVETYLTYRLSVFRQYSPPAEAQTAQSSSLWKN